MQVAVYGLRKPPFLNGLYLSSQWSSFGVGISGVIYVGYDISKLILRNKNKKF